MIRRSPTRIELKLEDLADFDYIQKFEKKKAPNSVVAVSGISAADAQKFIRQDRIGFRPIRAGAATGSGSGSGSSGNWPAAQAGGTAIEEVDLVAGNGVMTAEASTSTLEGQDRDRAETARNTATPVRGGTRSVEMEVEREDGEPSSSNLTLEGSVSAVDMSLDESL